MPAQAPASSGGYPPPGQGTPLGFGAPGGSDAVGYGAPGGYGRSAPPAEYPPASQPGAGYPQPGGQHQPRRTGSAGAFNFDLKRLTRTDQIIGIATLVTMISLFLTWVTGSVTASVAGTSVTRSQGESGTSEHGWLWLVFVLGLVIIAYLIMRAGWAEPPVKLPVAHAPLLLVATGLQLLLVLIGFFLKVTAPSAAELQNDFGVTGTASVSWGIGAYLGLIAAIVAAAPVAVPAVQSMLANNRR